MANKNKSTKKNQPWVTKALIKRSAPLADNARYQKALSDIENLSVSGGMKHILVNYVTDLALEDKKIPDKLLSRKSTTPFKESVEKTLREDTGVFELSGMISIVCATLVCMFLRALLLNNYLINFSVDALIGALALAGLILNLMSQFKIIRFYGSPYEAIALDVLAFGLWFGLLLLMPGFDTSLLVFVLTYFIEKRKFKIQTQTFLKENGLLLATSSDEK